MEKYICWWWYVSDEFTQSKIKKFSKYTRNGLNDEVYIADIIMREIWYNPASHE